MARFPFSKNFEPVVQVGENVRLIGVGAPSNRFYKALHIEPIQPFIVDFAGANFYGASIPAYGTTGYDTAKYDMEDEFSLWDMILGQLRIELLDDFALVVSHKGAANQLYAIKYKETYITKDRPRNAVMSRRTVVGTEELLWRVTNNPYGGRRVARIVGIWIRNEAAAAGEIRLGDGDGTGTDADAASARMSFSYGAGESIAWHEDEIPKHPFYTGVTWQTSQQPLRITLEVEEDIFSLFKDDHHRELFVWEDNCPYLRPVNPLGIALTSARMLVCGYKFDVEQIAKPAKWSDIPISKHPGGGATKSGG